MHNALGPSHINRPLFGHFELLASLALSKCTSLFEAIAGPVLTGSFEVAGWAFLKHKNHVLFLCALLRQILYNSISSAVLTAIKVYVQPSL